MGDGDAGPLVADDDGDASADARPSVDRLVLVECSADDCIEDLAGRSLVSESMGAEHDGRCDEAADQQVVEGRADGVLVAETVDTDEGDGDHEHQDEQIFAGVHSCLLAAT